MNLSAEFDATSGVFSDGSLGLATPSLFSDGIIRSDLFDVHSDGAIPNSNASFNYEHDSYVLRVNYVTSHFQYCHVPRCVKISKMNLKGARGNLKNSKFPVQGKIPVPDIH